ncbi:MAG: hypothetical protein ACM359_07830 [Bacillota bacterium]
MPKGSSKTRRPERARGGNHAKGEEASRVRRTQRTNPRAAKGEELRPFERAQALVVRAPAYAVRTMEQQAELMHGETAMLEQQGRKTILEAIDQAQKLAGQAQQVGACSIRAGANLAQDWLSLTWHLWDTAAETMRNIMRGEAGGGQRESEQPTA